MRGEGERADLVVGYCKTTETLLDTLGACLSDWQVDGARVRVGGETEEREMSRSKVEENGVAEERRSTTAPFLCSGAREYSHNHPHENPSLLDAYSASCVGEN